MPRSSATVHCTKKVTGPRTTTRSKQYLSAVHPLTCSLLWVRCLFDPSKFGFWGQIIPEWKLLINFCPKSAFHPRFTCHGQIWRKWPLRSCRKVISYCLQKTRSWGHFEPPILPPLNRSRPKFCERCRPLTCACVPTLVGIGCSLPDLLRKESKKVNTA